MKVYSVDHADIFSCLLYVVHRARPFVPHYRGSNCAFEKTHYPISHIQLKYVLYMPIAIDNFFLQLAEIGLVS